MPSVATMLPSSAPPPPSQRSRLLRDTLPEGVSPALVSLLEQSDGEEDEIENVKRGDDENVVDGAAGAPLSRKASSSSALPPPLSASERARAFAAAPRELEALRDHPVISAALFSNGEGSRGGETTTTITTTTTTTASEDAAAAAEAAAVEAFVRESSALSRLAASTSEADADLQGLESTLSAFQGSLGSISSDIRGLQSASAALARRLAARRAASAALADALDALALPPRLALSVSEGDPSSPEFAAALADLSRRMRKLSGKGAGAERGAKAGKDRGTKDNRLNAFPPLSASRAAAEVLPQLDALRRAATQRSKGWLLPAIASLRAPRTNVHVLQRSVLAPRRALVSFLREFGGDDYFLASSSSPLISSSSSSIPSDSSASSAAYAEVRRAYVETLSTALERHLRRYVAAVGRLTDHGGCPLLVGTGARPQIPPSSATGSEHGVAAGNAVAGALFAFVDAVSHSASSSSPSSSSSSPSNRSLDAAERGAILLHLDRPAMVPGATTAASGAAGGEGGKAAPRAGEGGASAAAKAGGAPQQEQQQHQHQRRLRQQQQQQQQAARPPPEEAFRSVCRLLADTATAEYVFCADFFGGDGAFRDGFGSSPLAAAEGFLLAQISELEDPVALLLMARVARHSALTMSKRRVPGLDDHLDRLNLSIWPRLQLVLDAHVASLGAIESSGGGSGAPPSSGVVGFFSAASSRAVAASSYSSSSEPALPGGAVHPLASRSGALEGALLSLSSPAEAGQLSMSLRRLRKGTLEALRRLGGRQLSRAGGGGAEGRAEAAAFVAGNAHAVLGLLEASAADAAGRSHAGGGGSREAAAAAAASSCSSSPGTSPVFAALGAAGADAAAHWHSAFEEAALEVAADPVGRRFPGLLEAARALEKAKATAAARKEEERGNGGAPSPSPSSSSEQATAAAREALSAAFSPALPSGSSAAPASSSWASSLDAVRADVARYLRKNPGAARAAASLAASAVGRAYAACYEAVVASSSPQHSSSPQSSPRFQQQQAQWPAPAVVARECARQ